jgi:hypothetical protein
MAQGQSNLSTPYSGGERKEGKGSSQEWGGWLKGKGISSREDVKI